MTLLWHFLIYLWYNFTSKSAKIEEAAWQYSRSSVVLPENNSRVREECTNSHICRDRESSTWFQADQMRAEMNKMATRFFVYGCASSGYPCSRYDLCQCQSSATVRTSWGLDPAWIQLSSEDTHTHTMLDITEQTCMYLLSNVYAAIHNPMYLSIMKSDRTIKWTIFCTMCTSVVPETELVRCHPSCHCKCKQLL